MAFQLGEFKTVEFVPIVAMMALIVKIVDFLRYAKAGDLNGVLTQLVVWVAGIAGLTLAAHTPWAAGIVIGGITLAKFGLWSLVFVGMGLGSTASLAKDTLKAVDNTNSTVIPTLLPPGPVSDAPARDTAG